MTNIVTVTIEGDISTLVRAMYRADETTDAEDTMPGVDWMPTWEQISARHSVADASLIWRRAMDRYDRQHIDTVDQEKKG
jgi:hypothetical protein